MNIKKFLTLIIVITLNLFLVTTAFAKSNDFKNDLLDVNINKGFGNKLKITLFLNTNSYFKPVVSYREPNEYVIILPETLNKTVSRPNTGKIKVIESYSINQAYYTNVNNKNGYVKLSIKTKKKVPLEVKQSEGLPKKNIFSKFIEKYTKWFFIVIGLIGLWIISIFAKNRKLNASRPVGLNSLNSEDLEIPTKDNYITPDEFMPETTMEEEPEPSVNFEETLSETTPQEQIIVEEPTTETVLEEESPEIIEEQPVEEPLEEITEEETEEAPVSEEAVEDVLAFLDEDEDEEISIEEYEETPNKEETEIPIEYEEKNEDLVSEEPEIIQEPSFEHVNLSEVPVENEEPIIIEPETIETIEEVSLEITQEPEIIEKNDEVINETPVETEAPITEPHVAEEPKEEEKILSLDESDEEPSFLNPTEEPEPISIEQIEPEKVEEPIVETPIEEPEKTVVEIKGEEEESFFDKINQAYNFIEKATPSKPIEPSTPPVEEPILETPKQEEPEIIREPQEEEKILSLDESDEEPSFLNPTEEPEPIQEKPEVILSLDNEEPLEETIQEEPIQIEEEKTEEQVEEVVLFEQKEEETKDKDEPDILAERAIGENKTLYIVNMDGEFSLIGIVNDEPFVLHKFDSKPIDNNIYVKLNEVKDNNKIYLVQVAKWRALIGVNDESMEFILAL